MTENKRFKVSSMMGDYYVQDNHISVEKDRILFFGHSSQCKRVCECLNALHEENEQLKKRNNNQYNQLNQLWQLIEAKDWETLTAMNNQMKKDEERLQREWKCYE